MIGAVTDRDMAVRAVAEGKGSDTLVRDVMSEDVIWCYEDDTVETGADKMSQYQVRRLPVVNREKRLVGIVSLGDFAVVARQLRFTGVTDDRALVDRLRDDLPVIANAARDVANQIGGAGRVAEDQLARLTGGFDRLGF